jgi:hypothetical protein
MTTFFVDQCPSVRAYDTHVDALVDTRPRTYIPDQTLVMTISLMQLDALGLINTQELL